MPVASSIALWSTQACVDLIAASLVDPPTGGDVVKVKIQSVIHNFLGDNLAELNRLTGIPSEVIRNYIRGICKPSFAVFIDLCYRMDIPPRAMIFGTLPISEPSTWRNPKRPAHRYRDRSRTEAQIEEIRLYLAKHGIDYASEHTLKQIAMDMTTSVGFLRHRFPELCEKVVQRCVARRADELRHRVHTRSRLKTLATAQVVDSGHYPSHRRLKATGLVKPSDLRRKKPL